MAKTLRGEADLLHGPVLQNMLRFALPILAGTLLQQLYSMVDAVVVGQFVGKTALAAVGGSAVAIINLLLNFFVGLCSGAAIVVAQYYGCLLYTSSCSWLGHMVSGLWPLTSYALFRLGFPTPPTLNVLSSLVTITRRTVLQKVRYHPLTGCNCL